MQAADLQVIRDIPGYKAILKTVLRTQIQQLVSWGDKTSCIFSQFIQSMPHAYFSFEKKWILSGFKACMYMFSCVLLY